MWRDILIFSGFVPLAVLSVALLYDRWKRKRADERPPQKDKLLRPAGQSLINKLADLNDAFTAWMMGAFLSSLASVGIMVSHPAGDGVSWMAFLVVFGIGAAGCTVMGWRTVRAVRTTRLGLLGEQSVAEQLQDLIAKGYSVFHDIPGDGKWNIDHVVVGGAGVFAIETKTRTKRPGKGIAKNYEAVFDGETIHFPSCYDPNAVKQARRNAKWLANMLTKATGESVTAQPIVALPGWFVTLKADSDVKVLSGKQVAGFIAKEPPKLSEKIIKQITYQLDQRCRDIEF